MPLKQDLILASRYKKYPYPPQGRSWETPRGWGRGSQPNSLKESRELNCNFQREGGGFKLKTFFGKGMYIFWNNTIFASYCLQSGFYFSCKFKVTCMCLCIVVHSNWFKNFVHFPSQSVLKRKLMMTRQLTFSSASCHLHVFASRFEWAIGLLVKFVTGQNNLNFVVFF